MNFEITSCQCCEREKAIHSCAVLSACSYNSECQKAAMEKFQGNTQETIGSVTGNKELQAKGKKNCLKGNLRSTKEDIKDTVTNN